ncbi:hypothetical protein BDB01DRAFT_793616 [Pilobolus umbonatus]|nr:hypothetical protein BDB01DRAFT_793616 [Pilobolus umbonatus]
MVVSFIHFIWLISFSISIQITLNGCFLVGCQITQCWMIIPYATVFLDLVLNILYDPHPRVC